MEILLLGIYSFFVWLIFIKFKWLPWNIYSQVTVRHHPDRCVDGIDPDAQRGRALVGRRARLSFHRADRLPGARPRDRGADRGGQRPGEEGRRAVPHRSHALPIAGQYAAGAARQRRRATARAAGVVQGRAGQGRRVEERHRAGRRAKTAEVDRNARSRAQARGAIPRAGRLRRRHQIRSRAGRDQSRRAHRAARCGAERQAQARAAEAQAVAAANRCSRNWAQGGRGIRDGCADPRPARERQVGSRPDHDPLALRLLRDQSAAATGRVRRRLAGGAGDDPGGDRPAASSRFTTRTSCSRWRPATRPNSRWKPIPGRSSRARSTRSSGRRARASCRPTATLPMTGVLAAPRAALRRQVRYRGQGQGALSCRRRRGRRRDLHRACRVLHIIRKVIVRVGSYLNYLIPKLH